MPHVKISVIGIGKVGSTVAFVLAKDGLANELVLYNRTRGIARADALDIQQACAFTPHRVLVRDGDLIDTAHSDIIVMCVGVPMPREMTDRNQLARGNTQLMRELAPRLVELSPNAIIINVTNPVDVITYQILRISGLPWQRVIGTGTLIDSARFRELLSEQVGIHPIDLNAYILGEHGESQFAALSCAMSGGEHIDATPTRLKMVEDAKQSAWEVYHAKGYTNYAAAMAVQLIVQSIVEDLRYTLPVSVLIDGYCGVRDVCLSVPSVIGRQGISMRLNTALNDSESLKFNQCAAVVKAQIDET